MPNVIKAEHDASAALTITLASLANSTVGVGRQSTMVDNTDNGQLVRVYFKVTTGTSPTTGNVILFYLLQGDDATPNITTDGAGASDGGITINNAPLVFVVPVTSTSNVSYQGTFLIRNPGPYWGIAVVNSSGVALNATEGNHSIRYVVENQEVQ